MMNAHKRTTISREMNKFVTSINFKVIVTIIGLSTHYPIPQLIPKLRKATIKVMESLVYFSPFGQNSVVRWRGNIIRRESKYRNLSR